MSKRDPMELALMALTWAIIVTTVAFTLHLLFDTMGNVKDLLDPGCG